MSGIVSDCEVNRHDICDDMKSMSLEIPWIGFVTIVAVLASSMPLLGEYICLISLYINNCTTHVHTCTLKSFYVRHYINT